MRNPTLAIALPSAVVLATLLLAHAGCGGGSSGSGKPTERLPDAAFAHPHRSRRPTQRDSRRAAAGRGPVAGQPGRGRRERRRQHEECGDPVPPPIATMALKVQGGSAARRLLDSTPPRRAGHRLLQAHRLHRRAGLLPGASRGQPRTRLLRGAARRARDGHGPDRPHMDGRRTSVRRIRRHRLLREPPGEPVPGLRQRLGHVSRGPPGGPAALCAFL